jgi:hypothetical protein
MNNEGRVMVKSSISYLFVIPVTVLSLTACNVDIDGISVDIDVSSDE